MNIISKLSFLLAMSLLVGCAAETPDSPSDGTEEAVEAPAHVAVPQPDPWRPAAKPEVPVLTASGVHAPGDPMRAEPTLAETDPVAPPMPVPHPGGPIE